MIHKNQRGKQPKRPLTDEWINKMWHMHTMEYYSALKQDGNSTVCDRMNEP